MPKLFIDPPMYRDSVETLAFNAYAMFTEDRSAKIEQLINLLAQHDNWEDFSVQCQCYNLVGIDSDTFTDSEMRYIVTKIQNRRCFL